jgi:hypothetical protein
MGAGKMAGYSPLKITGNQTGLVQSREEFLLPDDAYPTLQNAYVWRERILRKRGCQFLGRLQRDLINQSLGATIGGASGLALNIFTILSISASQPFAMLVPGSVGIGVAAPDTSAFIDNGNGTFTVSGNGNAATSSINYATGIVVLGFTVPLIGGANILMTTMSYYPGLPVMGARIEELDDSANDRTIFFDQKFAYIFNSGTNVFQEFIPGTTWNASGQNNTATNFFWSTNYWTSSPLISNPPAYKTAFTTSNVKLFWETNNTGFAGATADPPRITDGTTWLDFYHDTNPTVNSPWAQIDATNFLTNWLAMLPFRNRMVTFNTWEGTNATSSVHYRQRIRWSSIGNPFISYHNSTGPNDPDTGSWRSDRRGKGGFLDIPTNEDIVSVGFVRDNLVIYCERSTWQLRYTGRSIAPFQIERVNSELGAEGTFSSIQFDTSLVGIGDKGIVECDSYKSERIDVKIPDFFLQILDNGNGTSRVDGQRVSGIRDFVNKLAYWTIPLVDLYPSQNDAVFPNQRLVYNYENDSWALFDDSYTTLGTYQATNSQTWLSTPQPWIQCNFSWINEPIGDPLIVGGNQQGFVEILDETAFNDRSLAIYDVSSASPSVLYVPSHNLMNNAIISISGIPAGTPYSSLNDGIFQVELVDKDHFTLDSFDTVITKDFTLPVTATPAGVFLGIGNIAVRDNFSIFSKKFNFLDEGQNIQLGFLDILMVDSGGSNPGAITLKIYLDYDDSTPSNTLPNNELDTGFGQPTADTFFNATIPTTAGLNNNIQGTKFWQRVYCPTRASFLTLQYTLSNEQMSNDVFKSEVQIDAQVLHIRRAGRMTQP